MKKILLVLMLLLIIPVAFAEEKYSYEKAEQLKPLIEWREYSASAFQEAVKDNKPIFLLLTAPSWCYWCQVYESEEYLFNPQVTKYINANFIPVYVDADKRQDLTRQYLEGGWPSTTILNPQGRRITGFSGPRPPNVMISILKQALSYDKNNDSIKSNYKYTPSPIHIPVTRELDILKNNYLNYAIQLYDPVYGGFGNGQKFPQARTLDYFLDMYEKTNNSQYLLMAHNTLQNEYTNIAELQTNYNLFDPIEGGFHRYGTKRDYSPPHYEKMLYDNARLLKTYYHLYVLERNNVIAQEVVDKTTSMLLQWYDEKGGFAGNTDASPEDKYYGLINRPSELKPRLEKTKYTDWNSEAIITFTYMWKQTHNSTYKNIVTQTLEFYRNNIITTRDGAYHYISPSGEKNITGSLADNAYLLLAFVEASDTLNDSKYLETAEQLANYTLRELYDWNSSGFFERHSKDVNLYAPFDNINLEKPSEENGIMAYALIKLYETTKNPLYLDVAIRTMGALSNNMGGLDRGYYYIKATDKILKNNYLEDFYKNKIIIDKIYEEQKKDFWLNKILYPSQTDNTFGIVIIIIALLAGLISFISPCTLPILPAYIGHMLRTSKKNILLMSISFFLGLSIVFTLLGMTSTILGSFLKQHIPLFIQISGISIIILGIYILFGRGFSGLNIRASQPKTIIGGLLTGAALGIAWTPCIGPILVSILILASTSGNALYGGTLLFAYSIGLSIPLILVSIYLKKYDNSILWRLMKGRIIKFQIWKKSFEIHSTTLISGLLFILLGIAILTGTMIYLNRYMAYAPIQKFMFKIEEWLLTFLR